MKVLGGQRQDKSRHILTRGKKQRRIINSPNGQALLASERARAPVGIGHRTHFWLYHKSNQMLPPRLVKHDDSAKGKSKSRYQSFKQREAKRSTISTRTRHDWVPSYERGVSAPQKKTLAVSLRDVTTQHGVV